MYACMYVCICVGVYVSMCVYAYVYAYVYIYICRCIGACMRDAYVTPQSKHDSILLAHLKPQLGIKGVYDL